MVGLLEQVRLYEEQAWLRQFVIPEERRDQLTSALWRGEYRWFLADNVVPWRRSGCSVTGPPSPLRSVPGDEKMRSRAGR